MRIYNTLSGQLEEFKPRKKDKIQLFVCGPTVYDYIHIGNARTFVFFDVVAKYLRHKKYDVDYIQNITDIDDKIIAKAKEKNCTVKECAGEFEKAFMEDMAALGVTAPRYKSATDYIPRIIGQVKRLKDKGHAYLIEGDGWYFNVKTFPEYGKLSGRTAQMAEDGVSRIDESEKKRNKADFCLWKLSKPEEPTWPDAELGNGRPGWHIEDTAITETEFGPQYDIHGGGQDLLFPHHEAELTQQESASPPPQGEQFVNYWMHVAFLINKSAKMAKSAGNFTTVRDLLKEYSPEAIRFYLLSAHYRSPLDFNENSLKMAEAAVQRIAEFRSRLGAIQTAHTKNKNLKYEVREYVEKINVSLDNDFDTTAAFRIFFDFIRKMHRLIDEQRVDADAVAASVAMLNFVDKLFGFLAMSAPVPIKIRGLVRQREAARSAKNFTKSDELRKEIESIGYSIDDTAYGPLVKKQRVTGK